MRTAGLILDLYDDPRCEVLLEKVGSEVPSFLKEAEILDHKGLEALPDRLFALVAQNGDELLRKYAMHDEPHVTTSIIYFLETGGSLPEEAQKVAAANLVNACGWYGITPPNPLVKIAMQKAADLVGTEVMPQSSGPTMRTRTNPSRNFSRSSKVAGVVDLTNHEPPTYAMEHELSEKVAYALPEQQLYPIQSYSQVEKAASYFDEYWGAFDLADRHTYATELTKRASELGISLSDHPWVSEYAGDVYGPRILGELSSRARMFTEVEKAASYGELMVTAAKTAPAEMAEKLAALDQETGLSEVWNREYNGVLDPYRAVYGSKVAEDADPEVKQWSWSLGSDYVNDTMLEDLVRNRLESVKDLFDDDLAKGLATDPIEVFESLPDPQKHVIARLASDNSGGIQRGT